jgi:hypothetical protein
MEKSLFNKIQRTSLLYVDRRKLFKRFEFTEEYGVLYLIVETKDTILKDSMLHPTDLSEIELILLKNEMLMSMLNDVITKTYEYEKH